jgi:hypothetical protein
MQKWGLGAFGLAAVAGIVALGVGVLGGIAQAQEPAESDKSGFHEQYQEILAEKLGVTVDELQAAQTAARDQMIDDALAAGTITEEQAERLRNAEFGNFRGFGHRVRHAVGNVIESAADILGLTTEEVRAGLAEGKSLNDLATEQGVSNLEAQLVAELTADLQTKLADGSITQEQYDTAIENLADRVANAVEHEGGKFRGRFGGRGFGPGFGHDAPSDEATPEQD